MHAPAGHVTVVAPSLSRGGMTRAYFIAGVLKHIGYTVSLVGHLPHGESIYPDPPDWLPVTPVKGRFPFVIHRIAEKITGNFAYAIKPLPTSFGAALSARRTRNIPVVLDIDDNELLFRLQTQKRRTDAGALRTMARSVFRIIRRAPQKLTNQHSPWYLRSIEKRIHRADAITANTTVLQNVFGGHLLRSGKDTDLFDPDRFEGDQCRKALGLDGYFVVMFPGTARKHKGLEDVLEAFDQWKNPDARLVIVGGRSIGIEYTATLRKRWPKWIVALDRHGHDEMPGVIAAAHAVVITQRDSSVARAQFPIKLTDAMAMARPIVTTAVGDIAEVVADTAWVIPPSSPDQIVDALRSIASDPEAANKRGRAARQRCIELLGPDAAATAMMNALKASGIL